MRPSARRARRPAACALGPVDGPALSVGSRYGGDAEETAAVEGGAAAAGAEAHGNSLRVEVFPSRAFLRLTLRLLVKKFSSQRLRKRKYSIQARILLECILASHPTMRQVEAGSKF